jgi:hypothetical protein
MMLAGAWTIDQAHPNPRSTKRLLVRRDLIRLVVVLKKEKAVAGQ